MQISEYVNIQLQFDLFVCLASNLCLMPLYSLNILRFPIEEL